MDENRVNWKQIFTTAVITGIVAVISGMLVYNLQLRTPKLQYFVDDTIPFVCSPDNYAIYHIRIENTGRKAVEDVIGYIYLPHAVIKKHKIGITPSIIYKRHIQQSSYTVKIPVLNSGESATISLLSSGPIKLPSKPRVSLRGRDVVGTSVPSHRQLSI